MIQTDDIRNTMAAIIALIAIGGCTTERHIIPTISVPPRIGLELDPPILCAVLDGRVNQDPKIAASQLQADLGRIYGTSIESVSYFTKTPQGRVAIRVRIVSLGASFGSRLVSSISFANAVSSAQANATDFWGSVVANVSDQQSVFAGSFSGEGWWNGAAWIDLELQDYRGDRPISITMPIVAEHRESNTWGYSSGDKAAHISWQRVSVQLTRAMDAVIRAVRDQQQ